MPKPKTVGRRGPRGYPGPPGPAGGLTLRQYLAGQAVTALLAKMPNLRDAARMSVIVADYIIEELDKRR